MRGQREVAHRKAWSERQERFGNTPRSVLYKGLPDSLNGRLHRMHMKYILESIPPGAKSLLDVGCGYGRIAEEILQARPDMEIHGVELCPAFAENFSDNIAPCSNASFEEFIPNRQFDVVLMLTILMYQNQDELPGLLTKYWDAVNEGGCLICIEPYENMLIRRRQRKNADCRGAVSPCKEYYFKAGEVQAIVSRLPGARLRSRQRFGLLPLIEFPVLHDAVTVIKEKT